MTEVGSEVGLPVQTLAVLLTIYVTLGTSFASISQLLNGNHNSTHFIIIMRIKGVDTCKALRIVPGIY